MTERGRSHLHYETSEEDQRKPVRSEWLVSGIRDSRASWTQYCVAKQYAIDRNESDHNHVASVANTSHAITVSNETTVLLQLLRELISGLPSPVPQALIGFDPNDLDTDTEGWCSSNEVIVKNKDLKVTDLLLSIMQSLRESAAAYFTRIQLHFTTWENMKNILIAKFTKPILIYDYVKRVIKFEILEKESATDAIARSSGAILTQRHERVHHVVAYHSRHASAAGSHYH
ncbi:hypothetical protein EVAR_54332_1 [Eumeta japonica]|uniref:Uncharacterized protein n=1 Tax=Eumeta variegata TaxID=151549 RepID=A0A4C1Y4I2_EUMVA|nr:hypothetical protein EVAR_54332_1 [Eumeta japonica]